MGMTVARRCDEVVDSDDREDTLHPSGRVGEHELPSSLFQPISTLLDQTTARTVDERDPPEIDPYFVALVQQPEAAGAHEPGRVSVHFTIEADESDAPLFMTISGSLGPDAPKNHPKLAEIVVAGPRASAQPPLVVDVRLE